MPGSEGDGRRFLGFDTPLPRPTILPNVVNKPLTDAGFFNLLEFTPAGRHSSVALAEQATVYVHERKRRLSPH